LHGIPPNSVRWQAEYKSFLATVGLVGGSMAAKLPLWFTRKRRSSASVKMVLSRLPHFTVGQRDGAFAYIAVRLGRLEQTLSEPSDGIPACLEQNVRNNRRHAPRVGSLSRPFNLVSAIAPVMAIVARRHRQTARCRPRQDSFRPDP
jgi:hypothetical protein